MRIDVSKNNMIEVVCNIKNVDVSFDQENSTIFVNPKKEKYPKEIFATIINHLNDTTGKSYKYSSKVAKKHITARLNENWSVEDFITVIDIKTQQWLHDPTMKSYLRPETLFGTKFEGYLNEECTGSSRLNLLTDGSF